MITAALVTPAVLLVSNALIIRGTEFDKSKTEREQCDEQQNNQADDLRIIQMKECDIKRLRIRKHVSVLVENRKGDGVRAGTRKCVNDLWLRACGAVTEIPTKLHTLFWLIRKRKLIRPPIDLLPAESCEW